MYASPCSPTRIWKKSPRTRLPFWPPISVWLLPRWMKCPLARIGAVNVGLAACPFSVWVKNTLQSQTVAGGVGLEAGQESGPFDG